MIGRREHHLLGDGRVAHVALPEGYDEARIAYPLIVCLDAQWTFGTVCDASLNLGLARDVPRVVVVGLGWDATRAREVLRHRGVAYTPTDAPFPEGVAPRHEPPLRGGGAASYLRWMVEDAFPFLEERYRIRAGERVVIGHSLSALFGLYTLFTAPGVFSRAILASPSIWWDDRAIFSFEAQHAATAHDLACRAFMSVGSEEEHAGFSPMVTNAREMAERLQSRGHPGLDLTLAILDGETHFSTIPAAVSRGLRWVFRTT